MLLNSLPHLLDKLVGPFLSRGGDLTGRTQRTEARWRLTAATRRLADLRAGLAAARGAAEPAAGAVAARGRGRPGFCTCLDTVLLPPLSPASAFHTPLR